MVAKAMGTTGTASPPMALGEDGHPGRWRPWPFLYAAAFSSSSSPWTALAKPCPSCPGY
jgi:hypothetical protein